MSVRSRSNWNLELLVFKERGKPENLEKNLSEQAENQQHTQLKKKKNKLNSRMASTLGFRTYATLVGGECSPHCSILAP